MVMSFVSLAVSILGSVIYSSVFSGPGLILPFIIISIVSIALPPIAKKMRIAKGKMAIATVIEIIAIAIGGFNFYCIFFALTTLPLIVGYSGWVISGVAYKMIKPEDPQSSQHKGIQNKDVRNKETIVERWYTCPECGNLVRDGERCDCAAKRKKEDVDRRAEEATVNEPPSVWAYRWLNSQRAIGSITEEQYSKMGDAIASWETPSELGKNSERDHRLIIVLGSACAIFVVISIVFGVVISKTYEENKTLNISISALEAEHEKLETNYEKTAENYAKMEKLNKQNVETIKRKNEKIAEIEKEFRPGIKEWGNGIYNGTICVLLKSGEAENIFVAHTENCVELKKASLEDRMYFPSELYARLSIVGSQAKIKRCPVCSS